MKVEKKEVLNVAKPEEEGNNKERVYFQLMHKIESLRNECCFILNSTLLLNITLKRKQVEDFVFPLQKVELISKG